MTNCIDLSTLNVTRTPFRLHYDELVKRLRDTLNSCKSSNISGDIFSVLNEKTISITALIDIRNKLEKLLEGHIFNTQELNNISTKQSAYLDFIQIAAILLVSNNYWFNNQKWFSQILNLPYVTTNAEDIKRIPIPLHYEVFTHLPVCSKSDEGKRVMSDLIDIGERFKAPCICNKFDFYWFGSLKSYIEDDYKKEACQSHAGYYFCGQSFIKNIVKFILLDEFLSEDYTTKEIKRKFYFVLTALSAVCFER